MAQDELTRDIPEHTYLDKYWNIRARGLGGTIQNPVTSGAEENLLCWESDRYKEDIFVHELSHAIHLIAANQVIPNFDNRLQESTLTQQL